MRSGSNRWIAWLAAATLLSMTGCPARPEAEPGAVADGGSAQSPAVDESTAVAPLGAGLEKLDRAELRKKRRSLRAYPGAPPVIPHTIGVLVANADCMSCHATGKKYGINVPHPQQTLCEQCHVPRVTEDVFVRSDFAGYTEASVPAPTNPLGPPYIPHRIQDRQRCETCHLDPGSAKELVPRHGGLQSCVQCHVKLQPAAPPFGG